MKSSLFQEYWSSFFDKPITERERYFSSLSQQAQRNLVRSFFEEGWHELFIYNIIDDHLDFIKETYHIDVYDIRIKAIKGHTFLIDKKAWDHAVELVSQYQEYYDTSLLFGGITIRPWGKRHQFYLIKGA